MSCHHIGKGMNAVVSEVINLLNDNEINLEAARKIIAVCRKGVHWCDGNKDEAISCISRC